MGRHRRQYEPSPELTYLVGKLMLFIVACIICGYFILWYKENRA